MASYIIENFAWVPQNASLYMKLFNSLIKCWLTLQINIEGVADAISSFVQLTSRWFNDRIGQRKLIAVSGYTLAGLSTGMFALARRSPFKHHIGLLWTAFSPGMGFIYSA